MNKDQKIVFDVLESIIRDKSKPDDATITWLASKKGISFKCGYKALKELEKAGEVYVTSSTTIYAIPKKRKNKPDSTGFK